MRTLNKVLQRQIGKHLGDIDAIPEHLHSFLRAISETYDHDEKDRKMLERSIEISSAEMKLVNQQLTYANRLYAFISQMNQMIVRVADELALFEEACRIAVEYGKFKAAWIGMLDVNNQRITLTSHKGLCPDDITLFTNASYADDGPQSHVISTGTHFVANDSIGDLKDQKWKKYAADRGFGSFMVLPIMKSGAIVGTFNLYAAETGFFNSQEISLLNEATGDISFAVDILEKEKLRIQIEEDLRRSELRHKQAQEIAHFGNWSVDFSTGVAIWSEEALRIFGLPENAYQQSYESWISFIHPEDLEYVLAIIKENQATPQNSAFYHRIIRKDGAVRHIFSLANFELDTHGRPTGMYGVAHDVTDVKTAEQALQQSEMNLRRIMDLIPQAVFARDLEGKFVFVNKAFAELYGLNAEQMLEKAVADTIPKQNESEYFLSQDREVIAGGMKVIPEMEFTDVSGKKRLFHTTKVPYVIPGSNRKAVLGIALDVTAIMEAKRALRQSQTNLRTVVDLIPQSIFAMTIDGTFVFANKSFAELYGRTPKGLVHRKMDELLPDKTIVELFLEQAREVIGTGKMKIIPEMPFTDHEGRKRIFYSTKMRYTQAGSNEPAMLGISLDITEQKEAEQERSKIIADIVQRNKDLEQFSYIVSHNLRLPVANIIGLADLMQMPDSDQQEAVKMMQHLSISARRLDAVIKDLNTILEIRQHISEKKERVSFGDIVADITQSMAKQISAENITIKTNFSEVDHINTIKSYLYSIFNNLISNSIKYRRYNVPSVIKIASARRGNLVELTFKDNGLGIDLAQNREYVFGLYKRFHFHTEGKGMGLYMVKTHVETLGGSIAIDSEVDNGTTFTITLEDK